jgi:drug/metabolite transporter (DMT)-like permease
VRLSTPQLFGAAVAIWGTTWIAITFQLGRVAPEVSVAWRFAIAALLSAAVCRVRGRGLRFPARTHALLASFGLVTFCLGYLAVYRAETFLVSGLVAVGYSASPLVNMATARAFLGTRPSGPVAAGGLLGIAGIGLVFWPELGRLEAGTGLGIGAALTAAGVLSASAGNVLATLLARRGVGVWEKMAWGMAYGAAGCALAAIASGAPLAFDVRPAYVASLLYLAVLGSVGAFGAYLTLLERVGAARAGYVGVMTPVVALAVSGLFERFAWEPATFAGVALAVAGNVLVLRTPVSRRGSP